MARRAQLVCRHLEDISRDALEHYTKIVRQYVRGRQGVHARYRRGKPCGVGLAANLRNRLTHHLRERQRNSWDQFSAYLTVGDRHLHAREAFTLRSMRPAGSQQKGIFARSEELPRRFRQHCVRDTMVEMDGLFGERYTVPEQEETEETPKGRRAVPARCISAPLMLKGKCTRRNITARVRRDGTMLMAGHV